MKITFLIGNGFDIALGIKSSYTQFYDWYCNETSNLKHINEFRKNIKDDIKSDLPDDQKVWADFELGIGKYSNKFSVDDVEKFLECIDDAQENIVKYLKEQQDLFDLDNYTEESFQSFRESIRFFFDEVSDAGSNEIEDSLKAASNEDRVISFINFNYTYTLERVLEKFSDNTLKIWKSGYSDHFLKFDKNVIHAHGTLDEFPVLGVNDDTQILNKELLGVPQFRELLIKSENLKALGELWYEKSEKLISDSRFICILGMSLGASDANWWVLLADWLKNLDCRHIVIYWFEKNPPNNISTLRQLQCVNKVKELFLSYSNLSEQEQENLKSRIHVVINTKKFLKLEKKEKEIAFVKKEKDAIAPVLVKK